MEILSPDAFAARVREYGNKQVQLIAKKAGLAVFEEVFRNLLILTPVLTGHARYNWQPSIGNPVTEEQDGIAGVESTGAALTQLAPNLDWKNAGRAMARTPSTRR